MGKLSQDDINRIFGMTDALKKLDELVAMATVGGKKEKTEDDAVEENKYSRTANETRMLFDAFLDAGFSDDQAFTLTVEILRHAAAK